VKGISTKHQFWEKGGGERKKKNQGKARGSSGSYLLANQKGLRNEGEPLQPSVIEEKKRWEGKVGMWRDRMPAFNGAETGAHAKVVHPPRY